MCLGGKFKMRYLDLDSKFDLNKVGNYFKDVGQKIFGTIIQIEKLEKLFKPIRKGKRKLSLEYIRIIKEDSGFTNWWKMPEISENEIDSIKDIFKDLRSKNSEAITKIYDVIKNIEISSFILRFVDPQNYAIFSPPVENLLNIIGTNPIEKYLNYLNNLEELSEIYAFERIADVDKALWTLANILNYSFLRSDPLYEHIYYEYENTSNPIKRIMARNMFDQIKREKPLFKAELFLDYDYELAGIIAGRELEVFVKNLSRIHKIKLFERSVKKKHRYFSIPELLEKLLVRKLITKREKEELNKWWNLRCIIVHELELYINKNEVKRMIKGIMKIKEKYD